MFWEISDILWKCFGFHWLAKLAEIIKTCGKNQCFWRSLTTYGRALKSQVGRSHQKKHKNAENSGKKTRFFSPVVPSWWSIYLPAITCSHFKFRPSPTYWPPVCLPIYLYVCLYIYRCVFTFIFIYIYIYLYIYLQSPAVILSSGPPQPIDLLSAYLFINMYVCMYVCMYIYMYLCMYIFFHSYIFTCNHLQSF